MYFLLSLFSNKFLFPLWSMIHKGMLLLMGYSYVYQNETNLMKRLEKYYGQKEITFFDVGLNVGNYSHELYEIFSGKCKIYGFEPVKGTFELAKEKLEGKENVHIYNYGLGEASGKHEIFFNKVGEGTASLVPSGKTNIHETITLSTLDEFVEKEGISHIDFIKIDVEGYEYNVLLGGAKFLEKGKIDVIQFEFFRTNIESKVFFLNFWNLLSEKYRLYRILNNSLVEIREYHPATCEIFLGMNYLAVKKDIKLP